MKKILFKNIPGLEAGSVIRFNRLLFWVVKEGRKETLLVSQSGETISLDSLSWRSCFVVFEPEEGWNRMDQDLANKRDLVRKKRPSEDPMDFQ